MKIREIPWLQLGGVYDEDDIEAVVHILRANVRESAGFFRLPEEAQFEEAFAEHEGAKYAIAVNSCGTALDLACKVIGVGPGDEVITTPLTFVATATCILACGAKVVFADIDPLSYNLDPADVERKITPRTKAIIPVHMNGMPADIDGFAKLSRKYGVKIIYDAAHAIGTLYKGRKVGNAGEMSCYSFQSYKNMTTLGEGGAITTDNPEYAERLQRLKTFGFVYSPVTDVVEVGSNYRMTKVQSAVGLTQLRKVDRTNAIRRDYAHYLTAKLKEVPEIITPHDSGEHYCPYHLYMLRFDDEKVGRRREEFLDILKGKYRVGVTIHYHPVYSWAVFKELGYGPEETPIAEKVTRQLFNVPVFPKMSYDDLDYIVEAIKASLIELRSST